jgi:hypothetical protein
MPYILTGSVSGRLHQTLESFVHVPCSTCLEGHVHWNPPESDIVCFDVQLQECTLLEHPKLFLPELQSLDLSFCCKVTELSIIVAAVPG